MDVGSRNAYPAGALSNFSAFSFSIDGIDCASMEGFLQSLKYENLNSQEATCKLVGFAAKKKGSSRTAYWQQRQTLWWRGVAYPRKSKEYQILLNRAYNCLYIQNEKFRKTLSDAKSAIFTHSIGRSNEKETILTEREFCNRLQYLKDIGLLPE